MNRQQRIDAIRKALAAVESAIIQTEGALKMASTSSDVLRLTSQLADLKAQRQSLQFQLANLEAADGEIAPISEESAAKLQALSAEMDNAILDRTVVSATIDFTNALLAKVSDLRKTMG